MSKIKRIGFYGGPASGKSTIAPQMIVDLKVRGYNVHYAQEYIKPEAIRGEFPKSHHQLFVFANQLKLEDEVIDYVDAVVSDSPLLMNAYYAVKYNYPGANQIVDLANIYEQEHPGLHFWVHRDPQRQYQYEGRFQNQEESLEIDKELMELMKKNLPPERVFFESLSFDDKVEIIETYLGNDL